MKRISSTRSVIRAMARGETIPLGGESTARSIEAHYRRQEQRVRQSPLPERSLSEAGTEGGCAIK